MPHEKAGTGDDDGTPPRCRTTECSHACNRRLGCREKLKTSSRLNGDRTKRIGGGERFDLNGADDVERGPRFDYQRAEHVEIAAVPLRQRPEDVKSSAACHVDVETCVKNVQLEPECDVSVDVENSNVN